MGRMLDPDLDVTWSEVMREWSNAHTQTAISKHDLRAAIVNIDGWVDDNLASMIGQLPAAAKSLPTELQREIFVRVAQQRFKAGA